MTPDASPAHATGAVTTLKDVALAAGVSMSTASKALNDRTDVSAATRARVVEEAALLGFSPNVAARSLAAGRTGTVGILTSDLEGRLVLPILMGAEDAFGDSEISVFLCDARGDTHREQKHLRALLNRRVDGIIVVGSRTDPRPSLGELPNVPVVYAYAPSENSDDFSIVPDNVVGGSLAVDHLLRVGRTRIVHITGPADYSAARDRSDGAQQRARASGLDLAGSPKFGEWSERWGRQATRELLSSHTAFDAVFAGSDQIARGVLETLRATGLSSPDDVAVVGYDNWNVMAVNTDPPLTTIDNNLARLGAAAARSLFDIPDTGLPKGITQLAGQLIVRGSSVAHAEGAP